MDLQVKRQYFCKNTNIWIQISYWRAFQISFDFSDGFLHFTATSLFSAQFIFYYLIFAVAVYCETVLTKVNSICDYSTALPCHFFIFTVNGSVLKVVVLLFLIAVFNRVLKCTLSLLWTTTGDLWDCTTSKVSRCILTNICDDFSIEEVVFKKIKLLYAPHISVHKRETEQADERKSHKLLLTAEYLAEQLCSRFVLPEHPALSENKGLFVWLTGDKVRWPNPSYRYDSLI